MDFVILARGLVVIASKNEGMEGTIENNKNGFLIDPNKDEILNTLKKLTDSNLKKEMIKNTLLNIKNYQKDIVIKKYLTLIEKII